MTLKTTLWNSWYISQGPVTKHHWFREWLVTWTAPSQYLSQCWNIVNCTLRNKLQRNLNQNSCIFIEENAFENVVWKMADMLSWPQCVDTSLEWRIRWEVNELLYWLAEASAYYFLIRHKSSRHGGFGSMLWTIAMLMVARISNKIILFSKHII